MRLYRRIKRSTKQYIAVAIICIVVIGTAAVSASLILMGQMKEEYREQLNSVYRELKENEHYVFVSVKDIQSGDTITKDMIKKKKVYTSQPENICLTQREIGMTALIDISAGTQLLRTMVTDDSVCDGLREVQYQVINMNANIKENDTVDVRIRYPNGESYIVLSKKVLKGYNAETATCYFWNSEEEMLRMSAAIVDADLYQGAKLIITKYIEPRIQNASSVTYTPNIQVLSLIESDPNIVERCSQQLNKTVRKSLENRLADSMGADLSAIDWKVSDYEFDSRSNLDESDISGEKQNTIAPEAAKEPKELGSSDFNSENAELGSSQEAYMYYAKEGDIEYGN